MLKLENLSVKIKDTDNLILDNLNLNINNSEVHVIMGPNGTGKSTLSKVIMGNSDYEIINGDIIFDDKRINELSPDERARMGLFLSFQNPIDIEGVTNSEFLRTAINSKEEKVGLYEFIKKLDNAIEELSMPNDMIHRAVNSGASGGERKKNEILQMKLLKPKFLILDELDSGLDVDSLKIVCKNICDYLSEFSDTSVLIITHYPRILEYIKPKYVHVLKDGNIISTGEYDLALQIEKNGYSKINNLDGLDNNE